MSAFKPGDVAMVTLGHGDTRQMIRTEVPHGGWVSHDGDRFWADRAEHVARPLVVIDPEDREQVERLLDAYDGKRGGWDVDQYVDRLQAALREFANPTPPKPEEPPGLGAVVEDADGVEWVRTEHRPNIGGTVWSSAFHRTKPDRAEQRTYDDIDAVRVLSEGIS